MPTTLSEIEILAEKYSAEHVKLSRLIEGMNEEFRKIKKDFMPEIKGAVNRAAAKKLALHMALQNAPELFVKTRTQIFHGIKVGYSKGKGKIVCEDPAKTVDLIYKNFYPNESAYLRFTEEPNKQVLLDLPGDELKKIGCSITDTEDKIVIRPQSGDVQKVVDALLADAVDVEAS